MSNNNKINITAHISIGRVSKKLLDFSSRSSLYKRNKDKGTDFFFPFLHCRKNISKATHICSLVCDEILVYYEN